MKSVLDSRQLLAMSVLARTGSFTLAAKELFLTQSAVSHAIKALEEELECRLFTRTGRGVILTEAGRHFLQYSEKIMAEMETARTLVAPRTGKGKERLRLGVSARVREFILPTVLPLFHKEFPNKLVAIEPGHYGRHLDLLSSGLLDLVFAVRPTGRPEFSFVHLFEDELRFLVAPDHPWARRGRVSRSELEGNTLLAYMKLNNTSALLAEYFLLEGLAPGHGVELPDQELIKAMAKTGLAVGVLAPWMAKKELENGTLVSLPVGPRPLIRQWGVVYPKKHPLTPMEERFIGLCQAAVPGVLNRLQGKPAISLEKKEPASVEARAEPGLNYGGVALSLAGACNFFSESMAGANWGSILTAAS